MLRRAVLLSPIASFVWRLEAAGRLEAFGMTWTVPVDADWSVEREDGQEVLRLLVARPREKNPRRPFQYALGGVPPFAKWSWQIDVRREPVRGSLILVYAWRDPAHFNYIHLSDDSAAEQPVHNGIFHVYGGDRVRISSDKGPCSLPTAGWHHVEVKYDSAAGTVDVLVDGQPNPSLRAVDLSLGAGQIGAGSFFNTGSFRALKITGAS